MEPCLPPNRPTPTNNIPPLNLYPQLESLELIKTINYGITSKVKLGRDTLTGQEFAVKVIRPEFQARYTNALEQEAKFLPILSQEQHPNIIKLVQHYPNAEYTKKDGEKRQVFALIFELAQGGDLFECIKAIGDFQEDIARTYFQQLITTVEYLHDKNIVHGFLKLENLLLGVDFSLKIADFSFASSSLEGFDTLTHRQRLGLTPYMAPELLTDLDCVSSSTDLFSCGVILFLMVVGQPPFDKACVQDFKYRLIIKHQFEAFWKQFDLKTRLISDSFKDLVTAMLAYEPSQRLTIPEIKAHPWYNGKICSLEELKNEYEANKESFINSQEAKDREMKKMKEIKAITKKEVDHNSQKPKQSHFAMKGIIPFSHRSLSVTIDKYMEDDIHSPELNVDRIMRKYVFTGYKQLSEKFYRISQQNMFKLALLLSNSLFSSFKVHPVEYKIKGKVVSDNSSDFTGEILFSVTHVDDNSCCISVTKVKGPLLPFYKFIEEKFTAGIDKALEKFVENNLS